MQHAIYRDKTDDLIAEANRLCKETKRFLDAPERHDGSQFHMELVRNDYGNLKIIRRTKKAPARAKNG